MLTSVLFGKFSRGFSWSEMEILKDKPAQRFTLVHKRKADSDD